MVFITLLAVSLSIDALGIGTAYGVRQIKVPLHTKAILALESLLLMGISLLLGNRLTSIVEPRLANNIGVGMLFLMGCWLCIQSFYKEKKEEKESPSPCAMEMLRTPSTCDRDGSSHLDSSEALYLGFVLSIDSLGAGIGAGAAGFSFVALPISIAFFQVFFLSLGIWCGQKISSMYVIRENLWTIVSGVLLIIIGILRLLF